MELCRLWIEEIYVPGVRNLDGLKGHRDERAVRLFEASFSERESEFLHQFHRFLELRLQMLLKRLPEERLFPHGDFWQNIFRHARNILQEIDPDGLELDSVLDRWSNLDVLPDVNLQVETLKSLRSPTPPSDRRSDSNSP